MKKIKSYKLQVTSYNLNLLRSYSLTLLRSYALMVFFLLPFLASAQASHEISVSGGGGLSTINYKFPSGKKNFGLGGEFGLGYSCLFMEKVGFYIGADLSFYNTKATLDNMKVVTANLTDNEGDRFDMHTTLNTYKETLNAIFLNIPVMLHFQAGAKHRFYAMAGVKIGVPLSGKFKVSDATLTNEAYYPEYDNWLTEQEFAGYGTFTNQNAKGNSKLGISAAIALEIGGKWKLGEKLALYTGAYFDYGLNNIAKDKFVKINYYDEDPADFKTNSALAAGKINLMAAGLKVRFAFLPNGTKTTSNVKESTKKEKETVKKEVAPKKEKEVVKKEADPKKEKEVAKKETTPKKEKEVVKKEKTANKKEKTKKVQETDIQESVAEKHPVAVVQMPVEVDLTPAAEFTTGRPGRTGFPASAMGLTWVSNIDASTAKFTTAPNALVILPDYETYNALTTQEKLREAFNSGNKASEFTAKAVANFKPIYFIIQEGEILRLIEMSNLIIKAGESRAIFTEKH